MGTLNGKARWTSWGYPDLDEILGPLAPVRLYVIGARPSCGKTTLLANILNAIYSENRSTPRKVLCYWTELSPEVMYQCWAAMRLNLEEDAVLMGDWETASQGTGIEAEWVRETLEVEVGQLRQEA